MEPRQPRHQNLQFPPSLPPPAQLTPAFPRAYTSDHLASDLFPDIPDLTDSENSETLDEFKTRLMYGLSQMMFVSGETAEPSAETTGLIEEIVRQQVVEMVSTKILPLVSPTLG
jgi:Transcription initiation factor IID, 18kD subunit